MTIPSPKEPQCKAVLLPAPGGRGEITQTTTPKARHHPRVKQGCSVKWRSPRTNAAKSCQAGHRKNLLVELWGGVEGSLRGVSPSANGPLPLQRHKATDEGRSSYPAGSRNPAPPGEKLCPAALLLGLKGARREGETLTMGWHQSDQKEI